MLRKCKRCGVEKPLDAANFQPRKWKTAIYFNSVCRACYRESLKLWMRANRSKYSDRETAWYQDNKERVLARQQERYRTDPFVRARIAQRNRLVCANLTPEQKARRNERGLARYYSNLKVARAISAESMRRWRAKNPEKSRLIAKERKANRRGAQVETITKEFIESLFSKQRGRCAICTDKITLATKHIDHIQAIAAGGRHERLNLQLTCAPCNLSKQATNPVAFMQKLGFLL